MDMLHARDRKMKVKKIRPNLPMNLGKHLHVLHRHLKRCQENVEFISTRFLQSGGVGLGAKRFLVIELMIHNQFSRFRAAVEQDAVHVRRPSRNFALPLVHERQWRDNEEGAIKSCTAKPPQLVEKADRLNRFPCKVSELHCTHIDNVFIYISNLIPFHPPVHMVDDATNSFNDGIRLHEK